MLYSIWLQKVLGYANPKIVPLIKKFGSAQNIYNAGVNAIAPFVTPACVKRAGEIKLEDCRLIANKCIKEGITIISYNTALYPKALCNITSPPAVLYVKGSLPDFDSMPAFCIVGSRKCDDFAKKSAFSLGYRLAKGGMIIVSGGAAGADSFAHAGAVKAGGVTVCVMPCGVNVNYPAANAKLREAIQNNGCLISEFMPDTKVNRGSFDIRNRLLSALSLGVAVVCATENSGTMLTVNHALEQGREVFAIPMPDNANPIYSGNRKLLDEGAIPLLSAVNIFEQYYPAYPQRIDMRKAYNIKKGSMYENFEQVSTDSANPRENINKTAKNTVQESGIIEKTVKDISVLSDTAKKVYSVIDRGCVTVDDIIVPTASANEIFAALSELELFGFIKALPGGRFEKI